MIVLGDMNVRVEKVEMDGVIGKFEVPRVDRVGERMM
jgi:hypothetical protein